MAREIDYLIQNVFYGNYTLRSTHFSHESGSMNTKYMEIPVNKPVFEVPLFAFVEFLDTLPYPVDAIVASLEYKHRHSRYNSLDRALEDSLTESFGDRHLVKLDITKLEKDYYCTCGALFDSDFKPLLMCSWMIQWSVNQENWKREYTFIRPIVRVDPDCFINQDDALKRYIVKKFATESLRRQYTSPNARNMRRHGERFDVMVVMEECPFAIRYGAVPSYSTTNKDLLQAALDHINDVMVA